MINAELLKVLRCPETLQRLEAIEPARVDKLNQRIQKGLVKSRGGVVIKEKLDGALLREDKKFLYPIRQNLPIMLIDESIPSTELNS